MPILGKRKYTFSTGEIRRVGVPDLSYVPIEWPDQFSISGSVALGVQRASFPDGVLVGAFTWGLSINRNVGVSDVYLYSPM